MKCLLFALSIMLSPTATLADYVLDTDIEPEYLQDFLDNVEVGDTVYLDSKGGYAQVAFEMAIHMHAMGAHAIVKGWDECVSACTIVAAGAKTLTIEGDFTIGIHRFGTEHGEELEPEESEYSKYEFVRWLLMLDANPDFAHVTWETPHADLKYLTVDEAYKLIGKRPLDIPDRF